MTAVYRFFKPSALSPSSSSFSAIRRALSSAAASGSAPPVPSNPLPPRGDLGKSGVQWVFLGCPGVGKGTYASRLSSLLGVPHIATGDLVRNELNSSGPLSQQLLETVNQGKLVSDEIIISLLSGRLKTGEANGESGFILDGFPRTIRQAEILEDVTNIDLVVNLKLPEIVLIEKCLGRRICGECGGNFNVATIDIEGENGSPRICMAPLLPPPKCMTKLTTRSDDTETVVKERLRVYNEKIICGECGGNFNVATIDIEGENGSPRICMAPLLPPPKCMTKLTTRSDDTETVVKERLRVYNEKSQPVEEFYRARGKLLEFDLPGGIPESWPKLLHVLDLDYLEEKQTATA